MPSVTIELHPETEKRVRQQAEARGQALEDYLAYLADAAAVGAVHIQRKSWSEVAAPIADAVKASGLSNEEVEKILDDAVKEVRAERHARRRPA